MDIEIKNRRNLVDRLISAIIAGKNVLHKNRYVVNHIGETTYISLDFLATLDYDEVNELVSFFKCGN